MTSQYVKSRSDNVQYLDSLTSTTHYVSDSEAKQSLDGTHCVMLQDHEIIGDTMTDGDVTFPKFLIRVCICVISGNTRHHASPVTQVLVGNWPTRGRARVS